MSYHELKRATPIARKSHQCSMCNEPIDVGERYHYAAFIYDGECYQDKIHEWCHEVKGKITADWSGDDWEDRRPMSDLFQYYLDDKYREWGVEEEMLILEQVEYLPHWRGHHPHHIKALVNAIKANLDAYTGNILDRAAILAKVEALDPRFRP